MEKPKITLQGLEFTIKDTFDSHKKIIALNKKIKKYLMDSLKDSLLEVEKYANNPKSIEYIYAKANYELSADEMSSNYYYDENNLKEIFTIFLEGETDKIDYNGSANELVDCAIGLTHKFFFTLNKD